MPDSKSPNDNSLRGAGKPAPGNGKPSAKGKAPGKGKATANDRNSASQKTPAKAKQKAGRQYIRPRGGEAKPISDLMPHIGRTAFRRFGFVQSSVVSRWPEIVGQHHAKVCAPEAIRFPYGKKSGGILQLVVLPAHAPLIQQVIPEITDRVNRFFGYKAVANIKIRQGLVQPAEDKGAANRRKAPPSLKAVPVSLSDSLRDIGDPELRTVLENLARSLGSEDTTSE